MAIAPRLTKEELKSFKPIQDWVVIRKYVLPGATDAGIILPYDSKNLQSKRGTVVKIGPCDNLKHLKLPKPEIKVGDEVLFSAFSGNEIPMPDGYLIMRSKDVLGVYE